MFTINTKRWGEARIRFIHLNPTLGWGVAGGTSCYVLDKKSEKDGHIAAGHTNIHPLDLNSYCKETGRKLSLKRALENLGATRPERTKFWNAYFASKKKDIGE